MPYCGFDEQMLKGVLKLNKGLVDEVRLIINPVILGTGNSLFRGVNGRIKLKLVKTKLFQSGNILCFYEIEKQEHSR